MALDDKDQNADGFIDDNDIIKADAPDHDAEPGAETAAKAQGKPVGKAGPDDDEDDEDFEKIESKTLAEIAKLNERLERREEREHERPAQRPVEAAKPPEIPEDIRELLESDDPAERREGKREQRRWEHDRRLDDRLTVIEARSQEAAEREMVRQLEPEIASAAEKFGLTEDEHDRVVEWITDPRFPNRADLSFEKAITRAFPGKQPASRATPADREERTATGAPRRQPGHLIAGNGTGGRAPAKWSPSKDGSTTTDDAIEAGMRDRFGRFARFGG